jgi:hypothetical protein
MLFRQFSGSFKLDLPSLGSHGIALALVPNLPAGALEVRSNRWELGTHHCARCEITDLCAFDLLRDRQMRVGCEFPFILKWRYLAEFIVPSRSQRFKGDSLAIKPASWVKWNG